MLNRILLLLLICVVGGGAFAVPSLGQEDFLSRWIGMAALFAALALGFLFGEQIDLARRRNEHRLRNIGLLLIAATVLLVTLFLIGSYLPPMIGQSESRLLFPMLFVIGLLGGVAENSLKLKRSQRSKKNPPPSS